MSAADREVDVEAVARHERAALLRFARRLTYSREDAEDACQRAFEILVRHCRRVEPEWVAPWLRTVVRHEALGLGRSGRRALLVSEEVLDRADPSEGSNVEDLCQRLDERRRAESDLPRLKPQERRALGLLAAGHSYREICQITGWTYTKVNRCVTEGRRRLRELESERARQRTTSPPVALAA